MPEGRLYIGTRRYSSWSLRGWLAVRLAGLDVEEVVIPLQGGETAAVKRVSPSGLVPCLEHGGALIWETLAIAEYCAELAPALWPAERAVRAHARAIASEMHAGFGELRRAMPMNLGMHAPGIRRTPAVLADVARIEAVWTGTRGRFGADGQFLFGATFGLADAMYAPVVARFLSYLPDLSEVASAYCKAVRTHPLVAAWYAAAAEEPVSWRLEKYENLA